MAVGATIKQIVGVLVRQLCKLSLEGIQKKTQSAITTYCASVSLMGRAPVAHRPPCADNYDEKNTLEVGGLPDSADKTHIS